MNNVEICDENVVRKVDSLGRVSIPSGLRNRYGLNSGDELNFSTMNVGGRNYILMDKDNGIDPKFQITFETLNELGCAIPNALNKVLYGAEC